MERGDRKRRRPPLPAYYPPGSLSGQDHLENRLETQDLSPPEYGGRQRPRGGASTNLNWKEQKETTFPKRRNPPGGPSLWLLLLVLLPFLDPKNLCDL